MHEYTTTEAAEMLQITAARVRQLMPDNVRRIGNIIVLTRAQIAKMAKRNLKPGPKGPRKPKGAKNNGKK